MVLVRALTVFCVFIGFYSIVGVFFPSPLYFPSPSYPCVFLSTPLLMFFSFWFLVFSTSLFNCCFPSLLSLHPLHPVLVSSFLPLFPVFWFLYSVFFIRFFPPLLMFFLLPTFLLYLSHPTLPLCVPLYPVFLFISFLAIIAPCSIYIVVVLGNSQNNIKVPQIRYLGKSMCS